LHGSALNSYIFQAVAWKNDFRAKKEFCWSATEGNLTRYSNDVVAFIKRLTVADLESTLKDYRAYQATIRKRKKG
ncbi:MAG: hypothetical protein ACREQX_13510, partial [Candidatus Binataceae bacterium]